MIGIQEAIFNTMKADSELLNLLGLASAGEADISKRLVPTTPNRMSESPLIHFRLPQTDLSFRSALWEFQNVQFRIWAKDNSLRIQQEICERLQALFINQEIRIEGLGHYSKFFYVGQGVLGGTAGEMHGWFLELRLGKQVKYFSEGG